MTRTQLLELAEARAAQPGLTRRPTVAALEERLLLPRPCLDHGFVRLIDYMGDDNAIVQAARVSYGKGTKGRRSDRGLIRYLMRNRHTSPLEMCEIKLHMKMPIFVARQLVRHRTASLNEVSARYSVLDQEFYLPDPEDLCVQSSSNMQGRAEPLSAAQAAQVLAMLKHDAASAYQTYETLLGEEYGLARELARMNLPVNIYTQWYWKVDLHNLLHFLALRLHPHAQKEARVYAEAIAELVQAWVPLVWEAFEHYRLQAHAFSGPEMKALQALLRGLELVQGRLDQEARKLFLEAHGVETDTERAAFWRALDLL